MCEISAVSSLALTLCVLVTLIGWGSQDPLTLWLFLRDYPGRSPQMAEPGLSTTNSPSCVVFRSAFIDEFFSLLRLIFCFFACLMIFGGTPDIVNFVLLGV